MDPGKEYWARAIGEDILSKYPHLEPQKVYDLLHEGQAVAHVDVRVDLPGGSVSVSIPVSRDDFKQVLASYISSAVSAFMSAVPQGEQRQDSREQHEQDRHDQEQEKQEKPEKQEKQDKEDVQEQRERRKYGPVPPTIKDFNALKQEIQDRGIELRSNWSSNVGILRRLVQQGRLTEEQYRILESGWGRR